MTRYSTPHGFYELNNFPGCAQLIVSNHAFVLPEHRGQGHGKAGHLARLNHMKSLGYSAAICTVKCYNKPQKAILKRFGWSKVFSFYNDETDTIVEVWMINLQGD